MSSHACDLHNIPLLTQEFHHQPAPWTNKSSVQLQAWWKSISADHVTELCAGGNWKLSWIIQAVMSTKTPSGVSQQNHTGKCSTGMLESETFSATLIPAFEIILPKQTRNYGINDKTPRIGGGNLDGSQEAKNSIHCLRTSRNKEIEPTTQRNNFKHPVFHTVLNAFY